MRCLRSFTAKWPKELTAEAPALGHAIAVWRERRELAAGVLRACAASLWRVGLILSAHGAEWRGPIAVLRIGVAAAVGLATIQAAFLARRLTTVAGPGQGRRGPEAGAMRRRLLLRGGHLRVRSAAPVPPALARHTARPHRCRGSEAVAEEAAAKPRDIMR